MHMVLPYRVLTVQLVVLSLGASRDAWAAGDVDDPVLRPRKPIAYQLEVGPSVSYVIRSVVHQDNGLRYRDGWLPGLQLRASIFPWLRLTGRYRSGYHEIAWHPNALGVSGINYQSSPTRFVTLDGYVHPTFSPLPRLHVWGTLGIGWSHMTMAAVNVDAPRGPYLPPRTGIFVQVPVGLGLCFDVVPRWVTLSYEALYESVVVQSGTMYEPSRYLTPAGVLGDVGPMAKLSHSFSHVLSLSLALLALISRRWSFPARS